MTNTLTISLGSELSAHGCHQTASCGGIRVITLSDGVIQKIARQLQMHGHDRLTPVVVVKDGVTVFSKRPLCRWSDDVEIRPAVRAIWDAAKKENA